MMHSKYIITRIELLYFLVLFVWNIIMTWHKYLWPEWQIVNEIGSGAYGTVYKIRREDESGIYFAALKVLTISLKDEMVGASLRDKKDFAGFAEEASSEISFMERLKGNSNIVSYEDHRIVFDEENASWIVLLRMEYLTSLADYFSSSERDVKDVVRLGIDICNALIICQKEEILHRDVKPGNIFVSQFGDFKLGDFGIAFITHNTRTMREPIGTRDYMAPEVVRERIYNRTVDLYSLGIIMYRILNGGRVPFIPQGEENLTNRMRKEADERRLNGEPLPHLQEVPAEVDRIVLKACSFYPEDRFQTAEEMRDELIEYRRKVETEERIRKKASMSRYFTVAGELDD